MHEMKPETPPSGGNMSAEKFKMQPYVYEDGIWYKYLHIVGGSGNWREKAEKHLIGGEFDFIVFYASPTEMEGVDKCVMVWCREKNIPYGLGSTIEEAYVSFNKNNKESKLPNPSIL